MKPVPLQTTSPPISELQEPGTAIRQNKYIYVNTGGCFTGFISINQQAVQIFPACLDDERQNQLLQSKKYFLFFHFFFFCQNKVPAVV